MNNDGLHHNKTIESIMFIFTQFSDARLFCKNKQTYLKNKPEMGNLTEK